MRHGFYLHLSPFSASRFSSCHMRTMTSFSWEEDGRRGRGVGSASLSSLTLARCTGQVQTPGLCPQKAGSEPGGGERREKQNQEPPKDVHVPIPAPVNTAPHVAKGVADVAELSGWRDSPELSGGARAHDHGTLRRGRERQERWSSWGDRGRAQGEAA